MTAMIQGLSTEFQSEVKSKQDALDVTQAHLRAATRELSEQRKHIQVWQARCAELDMLGQRVKNVEKAIEEEDLFDWTGRWKRDDDDEGDNLDGLASADKGGVAPVEEGDADASGDEDDEAARFYHLPSRPLILKRKDS